MIVGNNCDDVSVMHSFCLSVCRITTKIIRRYLVLGLCHTSRTNWSTFGDDAVPDMDSGSLFYYPHHSENGILASIIYCLYIIKKSDEKLRELLIATEDLKVRYGSPSGSRSLRCIKTWKMVYEK